MNLFETHLLTLVIFLPLGSVPLLFLWNDARWQKAVGLVSSLVTLGLSFLLYARFQGTGAYEFQETFPWLSGYNIFYRIGIDGFSLPLILLTAFLVPVAIVSSWRDIQKNVRGFLLLFLLLETGMIGVFCALDLFLFYVFWEVVLVPMYFLIGLWGGPRRIYAAVKFVLYTMSGSLLMLAAILYLYFAAGQSFHLADLYRLSLPLKGQTLLFAAFGLAFAIKIPLFPFHTWLPDAHVEAPTAGSVILAAVLLKMGAYGFVRFAMPLFPQAVQSLLPLLLVLSVIGIVYGALVSMVQTDLKKLVAYSSVSHLGFVMLGLASLTPEGVAGATLQMVNHGLSTGALFLLVGMVYERRHTREIAEFSGLATVMPVYSFLFLVTALSSLGLPGTNGFVGEFLILLGAFRDHPVFAAIAGSGVVFSAVYLLWMIKRVFFGAVKAAGGMVDLSLREIGLMVPILVLIFWIGFAPGFLLKKMDKSVEVFLDRTVFFTHGNAVNR